MVRPPISIIRSQRFIDHDAERDTVTLYLHPDPDHEDDSLKVKIPKYSEGTDEDVESFCSTLFELRRVMIAKGFWDDATFVQNTNVTILYTFLEQVLSGVAKQDWDVIRREGVGANQALPTTWRSFKENVAKFMVTKVCADWKDPYKSEKTYLQKHKFDHALMVSEYWRRVELINTYLPYLLTMETMDRRSNGTARALNQLWSWGTLSTDDLRFIVIETAMPTNWTNQFKVDHATDEDDLTMKDIITYFTELQQQQQRSRMIPTQMRGGGRTALPRRQQFEQRVNIQQQNRFQPRGNAQQQYRPSWRDNNSQYRPSWRDNNSALQQRRSLPSVEGRPVSRSVGNNTFRPATYNNNRGNFNRFPARSTGINRFGRGMSRPQQGSARPVAEQHHHLDHQEEERDRESQAEQLNEEVNLTQEPDSQYDYDDGTLEGSYYLGDLEKALPDEEYYEDEEGYVQEESTYEDELFLTNEDEWLSRHWTARRV